MTSPMMPGTAGVPARVVCRDCGGAALDDLGCIPPASVFAGQPLDPPWNGGRLYRCRQCHLVFRDPIRSDAEYERLYAGASEQVWTTAEIRNDQLLVLERIRAREHAGSVLDVGCYDGSLLAALDGAGFERFGIEASESAARMASQRGIDIVGTRIADLASVERTFDVICAIDVIEHVARPREFLRLLAGRLSPGGWLIVSTGDANAPSWRAAGASYWYCSFPEHLSFISAQWLDAAAPASGLATIDLRRFAYGDIEPRRRTQLRRRAAWRLARDRFARALLGPWNHRLAPKVHGRPGLFDDHLLVTLATVPKPTTS